MLHFLYQPFNTNLSLKKVQKSEKSIFLGSKKKRAITQHIVKFHEILLSKNKIFMQSQENAISFFQRTCLLTFYLKLFKILHFFKLT